MGCKHGLGPGGSTGAAGFSGPRGAKYSVLLYGFPLTARPPLPRCAPSPFTYTCHPDRLLAVEPGLVSLHFEK